MADEIKNPEKLTLDILMTKGKLARDDSQKPFAKDLVTEFVKQVVDEGQITSNDTIAFISQKNSTN